jgi:hypothetical protein
VGSGVRCETDSGVVLVGNRTLMDEQHVRVFVGFSGAVFFVAAIKPPPVGYVCACSEMLVWG